MTETTLYDMGFDLLLNRGLSPLFGEGLSSSLQSSITDGVTSTILSSGEMIGNYTVKDGYFQSSNFVSGSAGWKLTPTSIAINVPTAISSLDIPDATTANSFHVESDADTYWGCNVADWASDNDNAKAYVLKTGVAKFQDVSVVGTISGRSTATIAGAIDASGHFIDNALDTSGKEILGDFTFGVSGAIKMITDADNGLWLSPTGILGKKDGATTFAIGIDGDPTFAGTLVAASGTFGTITAGIITGVDVFAQQFRQLRWTVQYGLNTTDGWETTTTGGATLTPYASDIMLLSALDALGAAAVAAIEVGSFGIDLTTSTTSPITYSKSPVLECLAICTNLTGSGACYIRIGSFVGATPPHIGFTFTEGSTVGSYIDGPGGANVSLTHTIDNTKWHKYRIQVTPNGSDYDVKWYVDDVLEATLTDHAFPSTPAKNFGAKATNNWATGGDEDNATMVIGATTFQQDY